MKLKSLVMGGVFLFSCMTLALPAHVTEAFLDFRRIEDIKERNLCAWSISASPKLNIDMKEVSLIVNIDNSQVRIPVFELVDKNFELQIKGTIIHDLSSSKWVGEPPQKRALVLHVFSVLVDGVELVSWTKFLNGSIFITHNFRVYFNGDGKHSGAVWITEYYTQSAENNFYRSNSLQYCQGLSDNAFKYPEEERFLRSVIGPVWLTLANQQGFVTPQALVFPSVDELMDQKPVITAESVRGYQKSTAPVWKKPFLLPPILEIRSGVDRAQALSTLKSLQQEVALCVIKAGGADYSRDCFLCNEKLLSYYLEIIDDSSPLLDSIRDNLKIIRKMLHGTAIRGRVDLTPKDKCKKQ